MNFTWNTIADRKKYKIANVPVYALGSMIGKSMIENVGSMIAAMRVDDA